MFEAMRGEKDAPRFSFKPISGAWLKRERVDAMVMFSCPALVQKVLREVALLHTDLESVAFQVQGVQELREKVSMRDEKIM